MITSKDLDYLSDMFNWQNIAYKMILLYYDDIEDDKLKKHLDNVLNTLYDGMDETLIILCGGNND